MCEHNTTVVIYSGKETTVEICEWGCDQILIYKIMPDGTNQLVREVEHPKAGYNAALEWAANWIIGAQLSGHGVEVQRYANTMAMSIRAAKRRLTPRTVDVCQTCQDDDFSVGDYCPECGTRH